MQLLFYVMLGALSGLVGILYVRRFYGLTHLFHEMALPKWLKPAIGGLATLAVMLMVAEMTGNLCLLAPAVIAVAVSTALVGDETVYRAQLRDRASSPFHRIEFSYPLLSTMTVSDAMTRIAPEARAETEKAIVELGPRQVGQGRGAAESPQTGQRSTFSIRASQPCPGSRSITQ